VEVPKSGDIGKYALKVHTDQTGSTEDDGGKNPKKGLKKIENQHKGKGIMKGKGGGVKKKRLRWGRNQQRVEERTGRTRVTTTNLGTNSTRTVSKDQKGSEGARGVGWGVWGVTSKGGVGKNIPMKKKSVEEENQIIKPGKNVTSGGGEAT